MDRDDLLQLLKSVEKWNKWRQTFPSMKSLEGANLEGADLEGADFRRLNLTGAKFAGANLKRVKFSGADLTHADLTEATLDGGNLRGATLVSASLRKVKMTKVDAPFAVFQQADLSCAKLKGCIFHGARFDYANLQSARLTESLFHGAVFEGTDLAGTDFSRSFFGDTFLGICNYSQAIGLDLVEHLGSSLLALSSMEGFGQELPEMFLRGCGVSEREIAYFRSIVGSPIRFYTCFISYSTKDEPFATRLHNDLQANGVRCWKWNEDAKAGRSIWGEIDQAIRKYDKLVLVASRHSLTAPAVNREIERALQEEDERYKQKVAGKAVDADVLIPVRIDNYLLKGWEHGRKRDVINKVSPDAVGWDTNNAKYEKVLQVLLRDLKPEPSI